MITEANFRVLGMSCDHCQKSVEKSIQELAGINDVQVNLKKEQIMVTYNSDLVDVKKIKEAVKKAGYQPE